MRFHVWIVAGTNIPTSSLCSSGEKSDDGTDWDYGPWDPQRALEIMLAVKAKFPFASYEIHPEGETPCASTTE